MTAAKQAVYLASLGILAACQAPAGGKPQEERVAIDLCGTWEFRIDPEDRGRTEKWFEPGIAFDRTIEVPGAWNAQGVAYPSDKLLRKYEQTRLNGTNLPGIDRESEKLHAVFPGPAWYRRLIEIPVEGPGRVPWLVFGGVHRYAEIWVNGRFAGSHLSYLTPFRLDLSKWAQPGEKAVITVRVDARRNKAIDPLMGCMDTLDFLYVSWGGLHRRVTLETTGSPRIENVFAIPHLEDSSVEVRVEPALPVTIEIFDAAGVLVARGCGNSTLRLPNAKLWSPLSPHLYSIRATLPGQDSVRFRFGMREFKVDRGNFLLNGKPIFLRGYGDDSIFPNSICPPSTPQEYRRRLSVARDYGFNYVRHHSWIPPEEYLDVADEMGMMVQPEFPIAYRWDLAATPEAKQACLDQWLETIKLHRNHPSIVTWCMGNELYDSFEQAAEMYRLAKKADPTRVVIDSDGCGFKHAARPTLDFMVVQFGEGTSIGFQDGKYKLPGNIEKPVVCHEMGYFVTLHDLSQIDLFKGGLRPYWLTSTRELAAKQGVSDLYPKWLDASYKLQAVCLKTNIEAARRSRLGGMSVWLFQDYPNCAEGVVDMFWRPKAVTAADFRTFNAPTVLLLDAPRRSFWCGENAEFKLLVSRFEDAATDQGALRWELRAGSEVLASGAKERLRVASDGVQELLPVSVKLPDLEKAGKLTLSVELQDEHGTRRNEWSLWVFPHGSAGPGSSDVVRTSRLDAETIDHLETGSRVLLLDPEPVFQTEKTNFRLSSWEGGGPSGTVIELDHPALRTFPNDGWGDLQLYPLIQGSKTVSLDALPAKIRPIVRCIDRPQRLANRAYLFEAAVGKGKLLVSGFNVAKEMEGKDPATSFLLDQLVRYASGPDFAPAGEISPEWLRGRLKK